MKSQLTNGRKKETKPSRAKISKRQYNFIPMQSLVTLKITVFIPIEPSVITILTCSTNAYKTAIIVSTLKETSPKPIVEKP